MKVLDLNGKWVFHEVGRGKWLPAVVPGSNYIDLLASKIIEHPYYDCNEGLTQWVGERDWEYAREFTLSSEMLKKPIIMLEADKLDTIADIYINDRLVARTENAFLSYKIDIKNFVSRLTNKIRIKFRSPINYIENKLENTPVINNKVGMTGAQFVRKPAMHFGWDNNLSLPFSGICGDIKIVGYDEIYLDEPIIKQEFVSGFAKVIVKQGIKGKIVEKGEHSYFLKLTLKEPNTNVITATCAKVEESNDLMVAINNPEFWTTYEKCDKPSLYNIKIELFKDEELIDNKKLTFGLRTLVLEREKDDFGKSFNIVLNGEKVFVKGVTLMPMDSMSSLFNKKKAEVYLDSIMKANINLIRVFAGGGYLPSEFYQMCDERGILVWQDMPFVGFEYPFDSKEFLQNIEKETRQNVLKLHTHPSCIMLCGNYGLEHRASRWYGKTNKKKAIFEVFYKKIPDIISNICSHILYLQSSPVSSKFCERVNSDKAGTASLWYVWGGMRSMQKIAKHTPRFCAEFGMPSMPNSATLTEFITKKSSIYDIEYEKRQKYRDGNNKMLYYISSRFRVPRSTEDLVYYSQLTQLEYYTEMVEHLRRNMEKCSGVITCSLNDCWAGIDCSMIDYLGNYKAVYYKAKRIFAPLLLSLKYKNGMVKINTSVDSNIAFNGNLEYFVETFNGEKIMQGKQAVEVKPYQNTLLANVPVKDSVNGKEREVVFVAKLFDDNGNLIAQEDILLAQNKIAMLPDPMLVQNISVKKGIAKITIQAKKFARYVEISIKGLKTLYSDNYFDMLAGETKEVTVAVGNLSEEEIMSKIVIKSVANIDMKGNVLRDITKNAGVLLSPKNILDAIKYKIFS